MIATSFDPDSDLIVVPGLVWDTRGRPFKLQLVLDTGAGETIIAPNRLDDLDYSARTHGDQVAVSRSVVGREEGYMLRVTRFECLGMAEDDFRVYAQDLPTGWGIDGLIGLSFLRQLNYTVRSLEGAILVERAG